MNFERKLDSLARLKKPLQQMNICVGTLLYKHHFNFVDGNVLFQGKIYCLIFIMIFILK